MTEKKASPRHTVTLKFRLRDKHASELKRQARSVNTVFNFCNETQRYALRWNKRWPTGFDLQRLTAGTSKDLGLHAHTIQRVCAQYAKSRGQHRKAWLRWRGRKSLGWVPFNTGHVRFDGEAFVFRGLRYEPMHLRDIPEGAVIQAGSFNQDARGRWYINCPVGMEQREQAPDSAIGMDLGLKDLASLSDGGKIQNPRWFRSLESQLAIAHRAKKKRRAKSLHARIASTRADALHKASAALAKAHNLIFVGDVSSSKLSRTRMSKSVRDAGWHSFKQMLSYKAIRHGGQMLVVSEKNTTRTCSSCGSLSGPAGVNGLRIRGWTCVDCGAAHDRDTNAAANILRMGLHTLIGGTHV